MSVDLIQWDADNDREQCVGRINSNAQLSAILRDHPEAYKIQIYGNEEDQGQEPLTEECLVLLESLNHPQITALEVFDCTMTPEHLSRLMIWLMLQPTVTTLDLKNVIAFDESYIQRLMKQLQSTKIDSLYFVDSQIEVGELRALLTGLSGSKVKKLYLHEGCLDREALTFLFNDDENYNLGEITDLELDGNEIFVENMPALARLLAKSEVTTLSLNDCNLEYEQIITLIQALANTKVTTLDLGNNTLNDDTLQILIDKLNYTKITRITLCIEGLNQDLLEGIYPVLERNEAQMPWMPEVGDASEDQMYLAGDDLDDEF